MDLHLYRKTDDQQRASVTIDVSTTAEHSVSPYLTGKFCEHLWSNIYNGMEAQILRNPTFADWPFCNHGNHPDGGIKRTSDEEVIAEQITGRAKRMEWPEPEKLVESRQDALAHWWMMVGPRLNVVASPDAGPYGQRAQRVEVQAPGEGIAQWCYLPLHRVRKFEYRLVVRSNNLDSLNLVVLNQNGRQVSAAAINGLDGNWNTFEGVLELPKSLENSSAPLQLSLTCPEKGQFVIDRLLLYPVDHVNGADPDVIRVLKDSNLSVLRWPGGNFVSGYHWRDGVGPVDSRPALDNPAWSHIEPGMFGTDEFVAFCCEVGCEPMICVNTGNGTPEEAADWVEYCNGSAETPMGKLRAKNGNPEPYNIRFWEIGNELSGHHQVGWTTPEGYADRYALFSKALLGRDPDITLMGCGAPVHWGGDEAVWTEKEGWNWNRLLVEKNRSTLNWITDHILVGGSLPPSAEPMEVVTDFMAVPDQYEKFYQTAEQIMRDAGIAEPRLAITELQLFGRLMAAEDDEKQKLTRENMIDPTTIAEAVYDTLFYHMSLRLIPFVPMITHSATVNHGGGLRKEKERVYANPCYYARNLFNEFAGKKPCAVSLSCGVEVTAGHVGVASAGTEVPVIDAVAAVGDEGELAVSLVNRSPANTVAVSLALEGCNADAEAVLLAADKPWDRNSLAEPDRIKPVTRTEKFTDGILELALPPCSVTRIVV